MELNHDAFIDRKGGGLMWKAWYPQHTHAIGDFVLAQAQVAFAQGERQSFPGALPSSSTAYSIRDIPGKGKGMVAERKLLRGELFLVESPLFIFTKEIPPPGLAALYAELPPLGKAALLALSDSALLSARPEGTDVEQAVRELISIFDTNCFDISTYAAEEVLGVFPNASRINHSCLPNATRHFFSSTSPRFEFRAVREIAYGQEITISYIQPFSIWRERQAFLLRHWRFRCTCEGCSLRGIHLAASDRRRSELLQILNEPLEASLAEDRMLRALTLLDQEGYHSARSQFYAKIIGILRLSNDHRRLKAWSARAADVFAAERGEDADITWGVKEMERQRV